MGSVVSNAENNDDFVTNLCKTKHIVSPEVEQIFRMVDRADFMVFDCDTAEVEEARLEAYEDKAWRSGTFHLSAPCIYTKALEALKIKPKLSFLNIGSGTGYLSTMVGMLLGPRGINRGVEIYSPNVELARQKTYAFVRDSPYYDPTQFAYPEFQVGNGLLLDPQHGTYDRVYCGADVPNGYDSVMKCLLNVGGILVMPYNGCLVSVKRLSETDWEEETVLSSVSFAHLILPTEECMKDTSAIDFGFNIPSLQRLCRLSILELIRPEKRSQLSDLPLPPHLISFLTYDGILRYENPKQKPDSLIATGNLPQDTGSENSGSDEESRAGRFLSRLAKRGKSGDNKEREESPFCVYGPNGVKYVFSMEADQFICADSDTENTTEDTTDDTPDPSNDPKQDSEHETGNQ